MGPVFVAETTSVPITHAIANKLLGLAPFFRAILMS